MTKEQKMRAVREAFDAYCAMNAPELPVDPVSALQVRFARHGGTADAADGPPNVSRLISEYFGERTRILDLMCRMAMTVGQVAEQQKRLEIVATTQTAISDGWEGHRCKMAEHVSTMVAYLMALCTANRLDFSSILKALAQDLDEVEAT